MGFKKGERVDIHRHYSKPGEGLSYPRFTAILKEDCTGESWDVVDVINVLKPEDDNCSVYSFSVNKWGR